MGRLLAIVTLSCVTVVQSSFACAQSDRNTGTQKAPSPSQSVSGATPGTLFPLPPLPSGNSTVIGGTIRDVDPVRDQITLNVFGGRRPMKILYDERTQFYRDGVRTPLRDLRPDGHASVETVLDGTTVFARSIHILSQAPQGECQGQVLNYTPATGELTVNNVLSNRPIELRVPPGTPILRGGQAASRKGASGTSDLVTGDLVAVNFKSGNNGRGVASQIVILATPGSTFVFTGDIGFLDMHADVLVLVDPRDDKSYKISFDPALFPVSHRLRQGSHVTVTATFDGTRYVASAIAAT